jgi:hypothetical protein
MASPHLTYGKPRLSAELVAYAVPDSRRIHLRLAGWRGSVQSDVISFVEPEHGADRHGRRIGWS